MAFRIALPIVTLVLLGGSCSRNMFHFQDTFPEKTTRYWIGPDYWANRLQDWRINEGRIECLAGNMPIRNVHLLTRSLGETVGDLRMKVRTGRITPAGRLDNSSWRGFLIGVGSPELDYRAQAIIHHGSGENGGLAAGIDETGQIVFLDNEHDLQPLPLASRSGGIVTEEGGKGIEMRLFLCPQRGSYAITLSILDDETGEVLQEASVEGIPGERLTGNVALACHSERTEREASFWFQDWEVDGSKVELHEERSFGPVLCAMHTLSKGLLKLTAQLPPVGEADEKAVRLDVSEAGSGNWRTAGKAELVVPGWTATFSLPDWESDKDFKYRLVYPLVGRRGQPEEYIYEGMIRHDPQEKEEIVVAAFTGNSNTFGSFRRQYRFTRGRLWFPHEELVRHVSYLKPDFLVYTGDQVYEGRPTTPDRSGEFNSCLDYLYKWYLWCWANRELVRSTPAVCLPDDHDVYQGNIWGEGGRKARDDPANGEYPEFYRGLEGYWKQDGGGYLMPPEFVNMVQRTQTSHLPPPYEPRSVKQGISVYYCSVDYGGISFAVLEDRKFKSAPSVLIPDGKVVNGFSQVPGFDSSQTDVPGARLLGDRQLKFLRDWSADWEDTWMKVALSQTIFANLSTYPEDFATDAGTPELEPLPAGVIPKGYRLAMDMDSNGWPRSGRNRALSELRRGFAFMIGGDQHLGSIIHHGIQDWDDAGFSFCVPSIANLWPRRWFPPQTGGNHQEGMPPYTGRFLDGFKNRITVWAVANPYRTHQEPAELYDRAPGFGIVRLSKKAQLITMECWPRYADPSSEEARQYEGWPLTIGVEENYGKKARAFLPVLEFSGLDYPVIQVIRERDGEIIYTRRVTQHRFRPKVFEFGTYTVRLGEPAFGKMRVIRGIQAESEMAESRLKIDF